MGQRKAIPLKTKLASALLQMRTPNENGELVPIIPYEDAKRMTSDQIIGLFQFDHGVLHAIEAVNEPWNLTPRVIPEHREKTKSDVSKIAKSKRISRKHQEHLARLRQPVETVEDGDTGPSTPDNAPPRPRSNWPKGRKIPSRQFQKRAMSNDICGCYDSGCPKKDQCYRFTTEFVLGQPYFLKSPRDGDTCKYFVRTK